MGVTAAVTPKGERRRYALVSAAAELLGEGGFEAVRHRAVARRAGLPLASTTYYFSSLDDLIARAVEHIGMIEVAQLRARVSALSRRRRGPETTAVVLVDLLVGEMSSPGLAEQLISRYERHIACTRLPDLRESMRRSLRQRRGRGHRALRPLRTDRTGVYVDLCGRRIGGLGAGRRAGPACRCAGDGGRPHRRARARRPASGAVLKSVGSDGVTMYPVVKSP